MRQAVHRRPLIPPIGALNNRSASPCVLTVCEDPSKKLGQFSIVPQPDNCGVRLFRLDLRTLITSHYIIGVLERHPQASSNACRQGERMLPAQLQRLEHDNLAGEMRDRQ